MRAIQITEFGSPHDVVRVVDLPEFRTVNLARDEAVLAALTASGADIVHLDDATTVMPSGSG